MGPTRPAALVVNRKPSGKNYSSSDSGPKTAGKRSFFASKSRLRRESSPAHRSRAGSQVQKTVNETQCTMALFPFAPLQKPSNSELS